MTDRTRSTIFLTLGATADPGDFARRNLRTHVLPALNQRFAPVGGDVQLAEPADAIDESRGAVVTVAPYSVNDLADPKRDVVEEISRLIASEYLGSTIASSVGV